MLSALGNRRLYALLTVLISFAASAIGTRWLIDWLRARQFVASENDRTMHQGQVPQGGGIAVLAASLVTALVFWPGSSWLGLLASASMALAVLSAINDAREIPVRWRLAAHVATSALALSLIPGSTLIFGGWLPFLLDRVLALLAFAWFINLYNFMDGIDGIAGVETITIALGYVLVMSAAHGAPDLTGLALAIAGAAAGFLVWNWHKARIFLGDVGSIPLGFLTGALLLQLAATQSLAAALILPLYYLTDATLTLARRYLRGDKVWQAHRDHAYQRAARAVGSHSAVVIRIAGCNMVLAASALLALRAPLLGLIAAGTAVAIIMRMLESLADRAASDPEFALNPLRF